MDIRSYLKKHGLSQKKFAKRIGATQSFISQLVNGDTGISIGLAKKIVRATKGEVSAHDLLFAPKPTAERRKESEATA